MAVTQTMQTQPLENNFFNSRELKIILAKHRGRGVPDRTLRFWRNELKIKPTAGSLYDRNDLRLLVRLVKWISRGGTVQGFVAILQAEYESQTSTQTGETIAA